MHLLSPAKNHQSGAALAVTELPYGNWGREGGGEGGKALQHHSVTYGYSYYPLFSFWELMCIHFGGPSEGTSVLGSNKFSEGKEVSFFWYLPKYRRKQKPQNFVQYICRNNSIFAGKRLVKYLFAGPLRAKLNR